MKPDRALLTLSLVLMTSACSILPDKDKTPQAAEKVGDKAAVPQASIEAKQLAAEQEASTVTEMNFKKGSAQLSAQAKEKLTKAVQRLRDRSKIEKVVIVAWADQEYPSVHAKDLPRGARDLAKNRAQSIADFLKQSQESKSDDLKIEIHNMAERPGSLQDFIGSADARVKKSLEVAGVPNADTSVKSPSKASHAMVLVIEK